LSVAENKRGQIAEKECKNKDAMEKMRSPATNVDMKPMVTNTSIGNPGVAQISRGIAAFSTYGLNFPRSSYLSTSASTRRLSRLSALPSKQRLETN